MDPDDLASASRAVLLDALIASRAAASREAALQARVLVELRSREVESEVVGFGGVAPGGRWAPPPALDSGLRAELAHRALVAEVAVAIHESERVVARDFDEAERLVRRLPLTLAALADGRIGERHARVLIEQSIGLGAHPTDADPRDAERRLERFENESVPLAETTNPPGLKRRARVIRERLLPQSIEVRVRWAAAERRVVLEDADDGMAWLHHYLPAEEAHAVYDTLTRLGRRAARGSGRTLPQTRADIARDLLLSGAPEAVSGADVIRPTVHVTVPVLTLLGASEEPAVLDGYGPIPADTARRLAARAPSFTRILTHPETGVVLSVGRDSYAVPTDLKRFVRLRDGRCRFPGCNRVARDCELDHTVPWADGGETAHDNLAALCANHHHLKHETAWSVERVRGAPHHGTAVLSWTSPAGRTYVTEPDPP
ncbi:HNH endonuclease [Labedella phragmitis]|uniref:HNH endonuclease n=1 Tax=Labedella phragmitis TaxID=2498849 RepID=A0A444PS12_9MICO|nr:HNH endonuclease signature motif containing protein [Labedella phragmitis]RWZ50037.1 HNH endonuclease [Labedella phragmitis]